MVTSTRIGVWLAGLLALPLASCGGGPGPSAGGGDYTVWQVYHGDSAGTHYSGLDQINRSNVHRLQVAWTFRSGDHRGDNTSQIQCNPIIVDGVLYGTSPGLKVVALDGAAGEPRWTFDPFASAGETEEASALHVNRGVAYWESGRDRRILFTAGFRLYSLDAVTGRPAVEFGQGGWVDLREGLGRDPQRLFVISTSPGAVYQDLLILGTRVSEGSDAAPGHIRAYDIRSGDIRWIFHTIPQPGEFGHDTWPENAFETVGGANAWSGLTVDHERGLVFAGTGSAAYDFYGGNRHGDNLFANCVLALDAATGRRRWHFQAVRHDLWDRDLPAPPNLVTVQREGRTIDAVAQITKSGLLYLLDRETGEPLFPVEERTVPGSSLPGEQAAPTQPFPSRPPPFARQQLRLEDLTQRTPEAFESVRRRFERVQSGGQFVPPSLQGVIIFPGFDGGGEWGGAAFDPESQILYVNSNEMAWILTMIPAGAGSQWASAGAQLYSSQCAPCHGADRQGDSRLNYPPLIDSERKFGKESLRQIVLEGKGAMPATQVSPAELDALLAYLFEEPTQNLRLPDSSRESSPPPVPFIHTGWVRFLDPEGYPAVEPPWGTLNAIDLNQGEILWQVPLGELEELSRQGMPVTGAENYGGPVVTAGGLIFIAATKDEKFRAFDKESGQVLWEAELPAGGYATPATYQIGGRQFVVIAAGGGKMGTPSGDTYLAFALPQP